MRTNQSSCDGSSKSQSQQQYNGHDEPGKTKRALGSGSHTHNRFSRKDGPQRVAAQVLCVCRQYYRRFTIGINLICLARILKCDCLGKGSTELVGSLKTILWSFGKRLLNNIIDAWRDISTQQAKQRRSFMYL